MNIKTSMIAPFVAYDFPCSYLGTPRPIVNTPGFGQIFPYPQAAIDSIHELDGVIASASPVELSLGKEDKDETRLLCPRRTIDGISSTTILESEASVGDWKGKLLAGHQSGDHSALAVEVWFTPMLDEHEEFSPIVSIAAPLSTNNDDDIRMDECEGRQLAIGQRGKHLELYYRDYFEYLDDAFFYDDDDDNDFYNNINTHQVRPYACRILRLTQWELGETTTTAITTNESDATKNLHHLVVSWEEYGSILDVFGNGESIATVDFLPDQTPYSNPEGLLRFWDSDFKLQLYSDSQTWRPFHNSEATALPLYPHPPVPGTNGPLIYPHPPETNDQSIFLHPPSSNKEEINNNNNNNQALIFLHPPAQNNNDASNVETNSNPTVFSGSIHNVAFYNDPDMDEEAIGNLYREGLEKRGDPFQSFLDNPEKDPFYPIPLVAKETLSPTVVQGRSSKINIGALHYSNSSTPLWDTMVEITMLPLYGDLLDHNSEILGVGDRILLTDGSARTEVTYQQVREDYFSVPTASFHGLPLLNVDQPGESFSYRLVAVRRSSNDPELLLGSSDAVEQSVTILHRNHPPTLQGIPNQAIEPEWQPTGPGTRPWATLGSAVVLSDEADHDIDQVRVDLWTHNGTLTIDLDDHLLQEITEIVRCSNPSPIKGGLEWICDGKKDRNMALLATPSGVGRILSNLRYTAYNWDQPHDSIVVRISDGRGGDCLEDSERYSLYVPSNTTVREECFQTTVEIEVPPLSKPLGNTNIWRDHVSWWMTLLCVCIVLCCTCGCAVCCFRKCRKDKKLNSVAVADNDVPVLLEAPSEVQARNDFTMFGISEDDRKKVEGDEAV